MAAPSSSHTAAALLIDPITDRASSRPAASSAPASKPIPSPTPLRQSKTHTKPFGDPPTAHRSSRSLQLPHRSIGPSNRLTSDASDYRADAFRHPSSRSRSASGSGPPPSYADATLPSHSSEKRHRRRVSALPERFPGDDSVHPLEVICRHSKKAYRSPHLRKRHLPGPDIIDRLDPVIGGRAYHHEGPFDAALLARNTRFETSPLAALLTSNEEALKATPQENIRDAVERHVPLDGVAVIPPGQPDRFGRTYIYEEGADLMREENSDGPGYRRWSGKDYAPGDLKGKSEPSFSLDKARRSHKITDSGIELNESSQLMREHGRKSHSGTRDDRNAIRLIGCDANTSDHDAGVGRRGSLRDGLKRRIGSLRSKHQSD